MNRWDAPPVRGIPSWRNPAIATSCAVLGAGLWLLTAVPAAAGVSRDSQVVMGTVLEVTVVATDAALAARLAGEAIAEARRWDDALTIWRSEGELARLNAAAGQGSRPVGERLARGLAAMLDLAGATGGSFEPAVGAFSVHAVPHRAPVPGIRRVLRTDAGTAALEPGSALDPGGVGKGLALDAMVELLRRGGATSAFLNFGGSSQTALGAGPGDPKGWTILLAALEQGADHGVVQLRDASLSTSRAAALDTTPILDPRTGAPVPGPRLATVRSPGAAVADAWSTALVVLGREGLAAASGAGVDALLEDAHGVARAGRFQPSP